MGRRNEAGALLVKILDLGLAKFQHAEMASATMTAEGVVMGTLGYMSPEQRLGREVDERTDIFAVGVMVLEALTGQKPFRDEVYAELARGNQLWPDASMLDQPLRDLLQRCLAVDPLERISSAATLHSLLLPALGARG